MKNLPKPVSSNMASAIKYVVIPFLVLIHVSTHGSDVRHSRFTWSNNLTQQAASPATSPPPPPPSQQLPSVQLEQQQQPQHESTAGSLPNTRFGALLTNPLTLLTDRKFNDFDWALSKVLDRDVKDNFVVSPISVKLAVCMLYLGVDGVAAKEIEKALKINSTIRDDVIKTFSEEALSLERSKNNEYDLNVGTKLFVDESAKVNDDYRKKLLKFYNTTIDSVSFRNSVEAIGRINKWCSETTKGRINQLIDEGEYLAETTMMLINAIYFRGEWETQFPSAATKMEPFWLSERKKIPTPTMRVKSKFYYYNATDYKFHLIRLPYLGKKFAMYLIVPHDIDGLSTLSKLLSPEGLTKSLRLMKECNVNLSLPKFQFQSTSILVPVLVELGIKEVFDPRTNLDKIGSGAHGPLVVSSMLQKSGIEVNEKGSVGYAATEVQIVSRFGDDIFDLEINRPFVFLIADEEKDAIIFTGKVLNPAAMKDVINQRTDFLNPQPAQTPFTESSYDSYEAALKDRLYYFDKELLEVAANSVDANVVLSPAGIKTAVAVLLEGAEGRTASQIIEALRLPENKEERIKTLQKHQKALQQKSPLVTLESESKLFIAENEKLDMRYQQSIKDNYYSEVKPLNFGSSDKATKIINDWVRNVTNGLIPTLVKKDDFDATTRLFLANCVYFKGDWESQFDAKLTYQDCFHPKPGQCQKSYLMTGEKLVKYQYSKLLEAKIVELPFKDSRFSMVLMLPDKEDGIQNLIKNLQHTGIPTLLGRMRKASVHVTIPRATIEFSAPLSKALQQLNIRDIFASNANLSGIFQSESPVSVREIIHKAKIEINEKGAKAAAATGVQVVLLSAPIKYEFTATYPFLFFIRDVELDGFLFEGIIVSPDKVAEEGPALTYPTRKNNLSIPRRQQNTTSSTPRYYTFSSTRKLPRTSYFYTH